MSYDNYLNHKFEEGFCQDHRHEIECSECHTCLDCIGEHGILEEYNLELEPMQWQAARSKMSGDFICGECASSILKRIEKAKTIEDLEELSGEAYEPQKWVD